MFSKKNRIYLDYASLTPIDPEVIKEMNIYSSPEYANPSSLYKEGVSAKEALKQGRKVTADFIHAHSDEIIFTSGGTEANNLAIIGVVEELRSQGVDYKDMHIVASSIEHSSVRECLNYLNDREVETYVVKVDSSGIVDLEDLKKKIKPNTVIVSVMTVNNEIGTRQPIREIAKIIRNARKKFYSGGGNKDTISPLANSARNSVFVPATQTSFDFRSDIQYPLFHTDAAQATLHYDLNVEKLGVDLMTIDGSKMYGPRGIGFLYKRRNVKLARIVHGGGQEDGLRSGTEPLPQIMGLVRAVELISKDKEGETARIMRLKSEFIAGLRNIRPNIIVNGSEICSPHILNVSIPGIDAEFFVLQLDAKGIACSTKSSCLRDEDESYVLKAIGANSRNSLRF